MNTLVVFYSRRGSTEKLALAAGVGAIQARANIRLRLLPGLTGAGTIAADAEWSENLERMKKDYIAPREIDAEWANLLILAAPKDCMGEMQTYLAAPGVMARLSGKPAVVLGAFAEEARQAGLNVVPGDCETQDSAVALAYGRTAAEKGRA